MPTILFVCTANICRSPMAAGLFRKIVTNLGDENKWQIDSAGTWGFDGNKASEGLQVVMRKRGVDLSSHRSKIVNPSILQSSDLILVMEKGHKEALRIEYPDRAGCIFLLSEMIGKEGEIEDPIGGPISAYESTANEIEHILKEGYTRIKKLSEPSQSSDGN